MIRTLLFAMLLPVVTTTTTQPDGSVILTIQNHAASTMTAYFYKRNIRGVTEMGFKDAAAEPANDPIPPNQQITLRFNSGEVTVLAALWADGSSYGDPYWINRLQERRVLVHQQIDTAIYLLQRALDTGMDGPALLKELQTMVDQFAPPNVNVDDIAVAQLYYRGAIQHLTAHSLSKSATGTPPHLTDREIIRADLTILERQRARLVLYR